VIEKSTLKFLFAMLREDLPEPMVRRVAQAPKSIHSFIHRAWEFASVFPLGQWLSDTSWRSA
jgi:hypothetical protein